MKIRMDEEVDTRITKLCAVCGESTENINEYICEKCKKAILAMRKQMEQTDERH